MRKSLKNDSTVEIRVVNTFSFDDKLNLRDNAAEMLDNRLLGNFASKNLVNVSQQNLKYLCCQKCFILPNCAEERNLLVIHVKK